MKVQKFILSQIVKINSSKNSKNVRVELKFLLFYVCTQAPATSAYKRLFLQALASACKISTP